MKYDTPEPRNPIDRGSVVGRAQPRIDGPRKTSGTAPYAYERHDVVPAQATGFILGAAIAKGRIVRMDATEARRAPGVLAVVTTLDFPAPLPVDAHNYAHLFGGEQIEHYHQAIAVVVAETFEQARAAAAMIRTDYARTPGTFDLAREAPGAPLRAGGWGRTTAPPVDRVGDFDAAFAAAPVTIDRTYTTPDETHAMMEPFATIAAWHAGKLTVWTSNQMIAWSKASLAVLLSMKPEDIRVDSPFVGGGFGGKLNVRADAVLAALGARAAGRPVKIAMQRPLMMNNSTHRAATIQRVRLAAGRDGKLTAIGHSSTSGNLPRGNPENAVGQTKLLYAAPARETFLKLAALDLPEANAMRAPGDATGLMALEIAIDEMAEALDIDPVAFRILNDSSGDPQHPDRPFSQRHLVECLRTGADRFGWSRRSKTPAALRDGRWLIGMGVAAGLRGSNLAKSGARVRLERDGTLTVETDMTDIGTGSYTIIAQTAAEMMGLLLEQITVRLGDSDFPASSGSGGQFGAISSTSGVYAACLALRRAIAGQLGLDVETAEFVAGHVVQAGRRIPLRQASRGGPVAAEDFIERGALGQAYQLSTFVSHFVEVAVDAYTGEVRIRRMLAVCDAGRIINPQSARSQVIGAMTMGAGAALTEELAVDRRFGFFVNHDLAGYEVPVHADIPHQDVIFLDHPDDKCSPMRAKGVGELGLCGVAAAIANAVYNATGARLRDYPFTVDKLMPALPPLA